MGHEKEERGKHSKERTGRGGEKSGKVRKENKCKAKGGIEKMLE